MRYAAWRARMTERDATGAPAVASVRVRARRGDAEAIAMLEGPDLSPVVAYLWEWYHDLRRGFGAAFDGVASLTWSALDAWARRKQVDPEPYEVDLLFQLDDVTRNPSLVEEAE